MVLFLLLPFAAVFLYIVFRKSLVDSTQGTSDRSKYVRLEYMWLGFVTVVFFAVNIFGIDFMHTVSSARAATNATEVLDVNVEAESWAFDISQQELEVGQTVRFNGKSLDTMHGFALYHPNGKVLFTMMLMPGMADPTSLVHKFTEPGTYIVRCLEYCGANHHGMVDEIIVTARNS